MIVVKLKSWAMCIAILVTMNSHLHASETVTGLFEAQKSCEATRKLNSGNPGNVTLEIGEIYDLLAINKSELAIFSSIFQMHLRPPNVGSAWNVEKWP